MTVREWRSASVQPTAGVSETASWGHSKWTRNIHMSHLCHPKLTAVPGHARGRAESTPGPASEERAFLWWPVGVNGALS